MRRCQCGVTAQIHFELWREPADVEAVIRWDEEGCFRYAIFHCDLLHGFSGQPLLKRTDPSRVAAKDFVSECVNLIDGEFHVIFYFACVFDGVEKLCRWAGVDSAWEQRKLEARKMLQNGGESHLSNACFVGWLEKDIAIE